MTSSNPVTVDSSTPIAVIVCSNRKPRCGPEVAQFVLETIKSASPPLAFTPHLLDLADWPLPFLDEPGIPSTIKDPSAYAHEHTRRWSAEISKYAGYVFVTPQYNWGYPAALKNAIDYLFNEWKGKPGVIVSYGGHGGAKAAAQLQQVLMGLRMRVAETMPALTFGEGQIMKTQKGEPMGVTGPESPWNEMRPEVIKAMQQLEANLAEPVAGKTKV